MKNLLKDIIRPLYNYSRDKNLREFYSIYDRWGGYERYKLLKDIRFLDFRFDVPDLVSFVWQFKELFVDEIYKFDSKNKEHIIYDCGANIGMSCLYFKKLYPNAKIKAFEADLKIANILKENLRKNDILKNVEIINSAVWIDENGLEFSSEGADGGSIYGNDNKVKISSIRLKDFLEKEKKIDMLKMDIEGAEYDVLKDCQDSLKNVENLFVEYHSWNNDDQKLSEILDIFEKNNFRYYVESLTKRKYPFINKGESENMDLQLNIFGVRR
jgi:FkbM family methyltransferase